MNPYFAPTEAELLAHSSFLEELSCSLVADRQTADDIVQDTWLAVLQHPPAHSINAIGWLGTVARNLARRDHRTRTRQSYREREVARPEGIPGLDSSVDRTQSLGRVAAAVEALPEPYRTVVFLRFFENLKPREIAEQLDVGLATIKSQLHRGLDRLRGELEDDFERDGTNWRDVLCACFGWRMSDGVPVPKTLVAASASLKSLTAAALFLAATIFAVITLNQENPAETSVAQAAPPKGLAETITSVTEPAREALAAPPIEISTVALRAELLVTVVDEKATPVAGATVWLATPGEFKNAGVTDALGSVTIKTGPETRIPPRVFSAMLTPISAAGPRVGLMTTADEHCASRVSWIEPENLADGHVTLVLQARGFRLLGRVLDAEGNPIHGVLIERHDTRDGVLMSVESDIVVNAMQSTRSDAFGRFEFPSLATGLSWLRFEARDFAETWVRKVVRDEQTIEMEVRLEQSGLVTGIVTDPEGQPVQGARIWTTTVDGVHELETRSDEHGAFRLDHLPTGERFIIARGGASNSFGIRTKLDVQPGIETSWYPSLVLLPQVNLELVDLEGTPISNTPIHLRIHSPARMSRFTGSTDEIGRLSVFEQSMSIHHIDIYFSTRYGSVGTFPDAHLQGIETGDRFHKVVIDTARITRGKLRFKLSAHDGSIFPEVVVLARSEREGVNRRIFVGRNKGEIRTTQVIPDKLNLIVSCTGLGNIELGQIDLQPGQDLELPGVIAPVPGVVRIDWRYPSSGDLSIGVVQHLREMDSKPLALRIKRNPDLTPLETYELFPGDYSLNVIRGRELLQRVMFTIRSGFETLIEVAPEGTSQE